MELVETIGFVKHEVRRKGPGVPRRHEREGPAHGLRSAGCVICTVTDWVPRVMGEEATPVSRTLSKRWRKICPGYSNG